MRAVIEIRAHRDYPTTHSTVIVTVRGRCYACSWAGVPNAQQAREAWRHDRGSFTPYNPVTGDY